MQILFDQGTPVGLRHSLPHTITTTFELGWSRLLNGELLRAAEEAGFDVLVTTDKNLPYQHNLRNRKIAVVILGQARWRAIKPALAKVAQAVESAKPGTFTIVEIPSE